MKLKIIMLLLVAFATLAFCAVPSVQASGIEITTTQSETVTTTTQDAISAAVDAQLEKAQTLIMAGVVSLGGASAVGGAVSLFLAKRRKQIEEQIAVAKGAAAKAQTAYDDGTKLITAKFEAFQAKQDEFQKTLLAKYNAAIENANAQSAKAAAIIEKYQAREEALAAYAAAEFKENTQAVAASVQTITEKASVECGKE